MLLALSQLEVGTECYNADQDCDQRLGPQGNSNAGNAFPLTKEIKMAEKKEATQQSAIEEKPQPTEDEIRERAYEIYCARNGAPGSEEDDWLKAEAELKEKHATSG